MKFTMRKQKRSARWIPSISLSWDVKCSVQHPLIEISTRGALYHSKKSSFSKNKKNKIKLKIEGVFQSDVCENVYILSVGGKYRDLLR